MKSIIAKKSWLANSDLRLDASYHLSEGQLTLTAFQKANIPTQTLRNVTERIFYGGRSRRIYVNNLDNGLPFIKGADIVKADFSNLKIISRKRTANLKEYFLEEGWTVITRSGTIGNTAYVNKDFIGKAASDDIIRVVPKNVLSGFLYAFLSSKNGKALLTHGTYGAVIQHIEPEHIENIPIPNFSPEKQQRIHELIIGSADLRVEANRLLAEAHKEISKAFSIDYVDKQNSGGISLNTLRTSHTSRFEATYYLTKGYKIQEEIIKKYKYLTLGDVTSNIFRPGIFKRVYVENGITFLGGSEITKAKPEGDKRLSRTKTQGLKDLMLKKHWILVTCGGTIGNMAYVDSEMEKCAASQHILRLVPSKVLSGYLYAFLSSEIGKEIITSYTYGSVIPQIEPHHISRIPIPIVDKDIELQIHELVMKYVENIELSKIKENQAIQLVEKEIEQWQN